VADVARGHVKDRPFSRSVYTIGAKRFSGDLVMVQDDTVYRVAWHRGFVVGADVPGATGSLLERAACIFGLGDASFTLDDTSTVASAAGDEPVDPRAIVCHGIASHYAIDIVENQLAALGDRPVKIAGDALRAIDAYGFTADLAVVVTQLLERAWRVDELVAACPEIERERVLAMVLTLLATDALDLQASARQPAATASPLPQQPSSETAPRPQNTHESDRVAAARPSHQHPALTPPSDRLPAAPAFAAAPAAAPTFPAAPAFAAAPAAAPTASPLRELVSQKVTALEAGANHYALLDVDRQAEANAIRKSYFALAKKLHPDRLRDVPDLAAAGQRLFARLNEAYGTLSDKQKRAAYDSSLATGAGGGGSADAEAKMMAIFRAEEHFRLGELALRRQAFAQASTEFDKAVELNPDEAEHHALAAWARWCAHNDKPAVAREVKKQFRRALALSPINPAAYFYKGQVSKQEGDVETAISCFQKVLELQPSHRDAQLELRVLESRRAKEEQDKPKEKRGGLLDRLKRR
jgi:curved DNA-binding protein CbpA